MFAFVSVVSRPTTRKWGKVVRRLHPSTEGNVSIGFDMATDGTPGNVVGRVARRIGRRGLRRLIRYSVCDTR